VAMEKETLFAHQPLISSNWHNYDVYKDSSRWYCTEQL